MIERDRFLQLNIVNREADCLISTGNVYLNMSGGVVMKQQLHDWLAWQEKEFVQLGF